MSTVNLSPVFNGWQGFNSAGTPLSGGLLNTYAAGTSTPLVTYMNSLGTVANSNPIQLGSDGRPPSGIWLASGQAYKFVLTDALGANPLTYDGILNDAGSVGYSSTSTYAAGTVGQWLQSLTTVTGAGSIGYSSTSTYSVNTIGEKIARQLSIWDNFSAAQIADAKTGTPTLDTTTLIQASINSAALLGVELLWEGVVLTGALATSANDIRWRGRPGARIVQKPAVYGLTTFHVSITGQRSDIQGIVFDGNQSAMISTQGSQGLLLGSGVSPTLMRITVKSYNGAGCVNYSINGGLISGNTKRGSFIDCHFDDNAGLGMNTIAACYHTFIGCTFDRNGYGFQKTRANYADISHGFAAFGIAIRLRSHHMEFIGCHARDNGRDGFDVNQGSYAIKFSQCLAYGNDDGGFTIASDNTSSGLPGEGESCYDIEYIDCEAYNNYTSGLAIYAAAHNVTVQGGRYYNNYRNAGNSVLASSYFNGIYFAGGSTSINVDTKAYDERQFRNVASVSGSGTTRTLIATGWVSGNMLFYPKVAIYSGTDQSFQGYAQITAEAAGSVTIQTTANNGVVLASIVAGMYVSQAVQHNGILADNGCQGQISIDGFGHKNGSVTYTGRNVVAGYFGNSTNILLPKMRRNDVELLINSSWDSVITGWLYSNPTGGSATAYTGTNRRSAGALALVGGTSTANYADGTSIGSAQQAMLGEFVEFGVWCYASSQGDATVYLFTQSGSINSFVIHPGGGWRYLRVGLQVSPSDTATYPRLLVATGKTVYFDSASLRAIDQSTDNREYSPASRSLAY